MKSGLIYLKQREVMENKFGKVDHSCQLLEEYKCQILEFSFLNIYLSSIYLSIISLPISKKLYEQGYTGWPKILFGFFCKMLRRNLNELFCQPNI